MQEEKNTEAQQALLDPDDVTRILEGPPPEDEGPHRGPIFLAG